jgi:hypothetical protein
MIMTLAHGYYPPRTFDAALARCPTRVDSRDVARNRADTEIGAKTRPLNASDTPQLLYLGESFAKGVVAILVPNAESTRSPHASSLRGA